MDSNDYFVAIRCMTFNHKPYIKQCLDGFVMQKTDFPFVAIIVDDASTDNSQEVLWNFVNNDLNESSSTKEETDDYVRVIAQHKNNKHCTFVIIFLKYNHYHKKTKRPYFKEWEDNAKYIALCEGDDFWIDSHKLQKQVSFMETHSEYSMCYHAVLFEENGIITGNDKRGKEKDCDISPEQMIEGGGGFCATCSLLYRKDYTNDHPAFVKIAKVGDAPFQVLLAIRGKIRYFSSLMGIYRKNVPGSWTSRVWKKDLSVPYKNAIEWLLLFHKETDKKYDYSVLKRIYPYIVFLEEQHMINKKDKWRILHNFSDINILKVCGKRCFLKHFLSRAFAYE